MHKITFVIVKRLLAVCLFFSSGMHASVLWDTLILTKKGFSWVGLSMKREIVTIPFSDNCADNQIVKTDAIVMRSLKPLDYQVPLATLYFKNCPSMTLPVDQYLFDGKTKKWCSIQELEAGKSFLWSRSGEFYYIEKIVIGKNSATVSDLDLPRPYIFFVGEMELMAHAKGRRWHDKEYAYAMEEIEKELKKVQKEEPVAKKLCTRSS